MKTISYKIKSITDNDFIEQKLNEHSACCRFIYKKIEESSDSNLLNYCKDRFNLVDIELRSIISNTKQVKESFLSKITKTDTEINALKVDITDLNNKILTLSAKKPSETRLKKIKYLKKDLFKLKFKLARKQRFIKSDIVFGSKKLLREISHLHNKKYKNLNLIKNCDNNSLLTELNNKNQNILDSINDKKEKYVIKRKGYIYLIGEANQKGNRFFDIDLPNKIITYKPFRGKNIEIKLCNRIDNFEKQIQSAIDNKQIAITISFNKEVINITYDETTLCGYSINVFNRRKEVEKATKHIVSQEERDFIVKEIYKIHYNRIRDKQLINKLPERYLGIDLNPEYIGYSILDKLPDGNFKIIDTGCFNFKGLTKKTKLSSNHELSVYRNNKRKHERKEVVCEIFRLMKHYKVSNFVMEDLAFKPNNKFERKEFNRKVKNIWDRDLLSILIKKKCTEGGFIFNVVNPVYTSLIGNLCYRIFDPVASSIEITRRGFYKYSKGDFFPKESASTNHTMEAVAKRNGIDVDLIRDVTWRKRHTILNSNVKFRYRWGEAEGRTVSFSLLSYKSRVKYTKYSIIYN